MKYITCIFLILLLTGCFKTQSDVGNTGIVTTPTDANVENIGDDEIDVREEPFYTDIKNLRQEGDVESVKEIISNKLSEYPNDENLLTQLGLVHIEEDEYDDAIQVFSQIITNNSNNIGAYLNIALIYSKLNDDAKYEEYINKAEQINPNSEQITEFLTNLNSENNSESIQKNNSLSSSNPEYNEFLLDQSLLIIREGIENNQYENALNELLKLEQNNLDNLEIQKLIADCYLGLDQYEGAIEKFTFLYNSGMTENFDVLFGMAMVYYKLSDEESFNDFFDKAKAVSNDDQSERVSNFESDIILNNGNLPEIPTFEESYTEGGTQFSEIQNGLDDIQAEFDVNNNSEAALELAVSLNEEYPNHPEILYWLGRIYFLEGDFQNGYDYYFKSYSLIANNIYTLEGLFWSSIRLGNKEEAELYFNKALDLNLEFESMESARETIQ